MMQPLTKRQREILNFIARYIGVQGFAPTIDEIGVAFGLSSTSTVFKHLTNLHQKGYIVRAWNRSRAITVIPRAIEGCCPMCGRTFDTEAKVAVDLSIVEGRNRDSVNAVGEVAVTTTPT